ncbi:hypothetical protein [Pectinatus haikarae]|uniref:Acetyltransferase-like isoleucine patch superfamily enzyme n=2 Tax=Pectinatus haikarae TaxID=349096 RepID=A0ABT9YB71_9FIRM|nr:hypothetical protein [Pectinatus haikarae]MDQ0205052.1 acetyltransferase-like isoleucine patch superfamily enzyme [Pectinatus haikarae]
MKKPFSNTVRSIKFSENNIVTLGKGSFIESMSYEGRSSASHILVGNYCSIFCNNVFLIGMDHNVHSLSTYPLMQLGTNTTDDFVKNCKSELYDGNRDQLIIGNDVWIGCGCTIVGGIQIGNGACVTAGSVVTENVPPYAVVGGSPARIIKYRFSRDVINKLQKIKWWYWNKEKIQSIVQKITTKEQVENFADKYFVKKQNNDNDEVGVHLHELKDNGYILVYFPLQSENIVLLDYVVNKYIKMFDYKDKIALIIDVNMSDDKIQLIINKYIISKGKDTPLLFSYNTKGKVSDSILSTIDYLITTKDFISLLYSDYGADYGIKLIYGGNRDIFSSILKNNTTKTLLTDEKKKIRFLAIGNSITMHGVCEYWWGEWGMGASNQSKDYIHLIEKNLKHRYDVEFESINMASWETMYYDRAEVLPSLDRCLNREYNFIILQLGENISEFSTLENDFCELIKYIRENSLSGNAKLIMVGQFWKNDNIDDIKRRVCKCTDVSFVDLSDIQGNVYQLGLNSAVLDNDGKEHCVQHSGVALHPNDAAMQVYAKRILKIINL